MISSTSSAKMTTATVTSQQQQKTPQSLTTTTTTTGSSTATSALRDKEELLKQVSAYHMPVSNNGAGPAATSVVANQPATPPPHSRYKSYLIDKLLNETPPLTPQTANETSSKPSQSSSPPHMLNGKKTASSSFDYDLAKQDSTTTTTKIKRTESREDVASEAGTYTIDESPDIALVSDFNDHVASSPTKPTTVPTAQQKANAGNTDPAKDVMSARAAIDETFGIIKRPFISTTATDKAANNSSSDESSSRRQHLQNGGDDCEKPTTPTHHHRVRNKTYSLAKDIMVLNHIDNLSGTVATATAAKLTESVSTTAPFNEINSDNLHQESSSRSSTTVVAESGADKLNVSTIETSRTINTQMLLGDTDKLIEELNKKTPGAGGSRKSPSVPLMRAANNKSPQATLSSASSSSTGSAVSSETPASGKTATRKSSDGGSTITPRHFRESHNQIGELLTAASGGAKNTNGSFYAPSKPKSWVIPTGLSFDDDGEDCDVSTTRATVNAGASRPNTSRTPAPLAAPENTSKSGESSSSMVLQSKKVGNGGMAFDFVMDNHHHHHHSHRSEPAVGDETNSSLLSSGLSSTESVSQASQGSYNSSMSITRGYELHRQAIRSKAGGATAGSALNDTSSSVNSATSPVHTPKSNATTALSLGARIQMKAKTSAETSNSLDNHHHNHHSPPPPSSNGLTSPVHSQNALRRRASDNTIVSTVTTATPPPPTTTQYTNRALLLRQQKARAKRESLDRSQVRSADIDSHLDSSPQKSKTTTNSNALKKTTSNQMTTGNVQLHSNNRSTNLNSSVSSLSNVASKTPRTMSQSKKLGVSRSNSRNASPNPNSHHLYANVTSGGHHHQNNVMSHSLNLPAGSALPTTNGGEFSLKEAFLRRKNYDPMKAVEQEKLKKLQKNQATSPSKQQSPSNSSNKQLQLSLHETLDHHHHQNDDEDDSAAETSSSFSIPVNSLTANISNKQTYEKILQSTLQRLCIRLIQMSTGVLDKIGDNNSAAKLSDQSLSVFSSSGHTELERMQQLAKLVNSMQLVNDHIQIIDSTLFSVKPEDSYMKELTRIRQEVDNLKQTAALNNSSSSSVLNINGQH